jgi:hypothetical protein
LDLHWDAVASGDPLTLTLSLRLSADVAFVRPEKEEQNDWLV